MMMLPLVQVAETREKLLARGAGVLSDAELLALFRELLDEAFAGVEKTIQIQALNNKSELLARWELTSVMPSTFSSAAAGNISEIDSTIEFVFDRLRLVEANGK